MSEYDNLYLCPNCNHVDKLHTDDMVCDNCDFKSCYVAKHVNEGTRKWWINKERSLPMWRLEKRFKTIIKNGLPENASVTKNFEKSVKEIFALFNQNKENMGEIFPNFVRDYNRTTGKRNRGWRRTSSIAKQNRDSLRGLIYEGAFSNFCDELDQFENVKIPISCINNQGEEIEFEPDAFFLINGEEIPIEFKTFQKGDLIKRTFIKGIKQSRRYGRLTKYTHNNPQKYSGVIICSPEERKFACALIDKNVEKII